MKICHLMGAMGADHGGFPPILQESDCLIAVDGGLTQLERWNLQADSMIGDFDSLGYVPKEGENILPLPVRKDETDMEYAMKVGLSRNYKHFLIQGGLSGRLDHSYANFQLLDQLSRCNARGILVGDGQTVLVVRETTQYFPKNMVGYCSIFALGEGASGISLKNLSYEGETLSLSPHIPLGVSNEFLPRQEAVISVKKGAVLVFCQGIYEQGTCEIILKNFNLST